LASPITHLRGAFAAAAPANGGATARDSIAEFAPLRNEEPSWSVHVRRPAPACQQLTVAGWGSSHCI